MMKKKMLSVLIALACVSSLAASALSVSAAESVAEPAAVEVPTDGDVADIVAKGKLVIGITDFEPMDYKDDGGEWIGFDADLGRLVAADLGVDVEFIEIDWDNKILELNNKSIDCVWNGMTLTDEVLKSMECTNPYCSNAQVVVLPADKAENFAEVADLSDLQFAVEAGSAGEAAAEENGFTFTAVTAQSDTLMEIQAGTSDAAIIDLLMASAMTGEGTSYPELVHKFELTTEEYGIGCRQGSNLAEFINQELVKFYQDGTLQAVADTYGLADAVIEQK